MNVRYGALKSPPQPPILHYMNAVELLLYSVDIHLMLPVSSKWSVALGLWDTVGLLAVTLTV
jgi:hypothetical protein